MAARKYSSTHTAQDVWEALANVGESAYALLRIEVTPVPSSANMVAVTVRYHDPLTSWDAPAVFVWRETLQTHRKVDLANYLHRVVWDSWSAYHNSPWEWSTGMRHAHARP